VARSRGAARRRSPCTLCPPLPSPPPPPRLPFVTLFESWEDLIDKLAALDLEATSRKMRAHAVHLEAQVVQGWRGAADAVAAARAARSVTDADAPAFAPPAGAADTDESDAASERRYAARMDAIYGAGGWQLY
jgi:hypothetical protein